MSGTDALLKLLAAFERKGVPYMLVGSFSSNFYGIPRSTKDADIVIHMDSEGWKNLPDLLPAGVEIEDQMSFEMVTSTRREILRVEGSLFLIELFRLSGDSHDRSRFERRMEKEIFPGTKVSLPTAEDVIVQKLRWCAGAKREKDFSDVADVMKIQGRDGLDWPYIERWCEEHGTLGLLEQAKTEARPAWDGPE